VPVTTSAKKRMRQNEKRRLRNAAFKSKLRTHRRNLLRAIGDERKEDSQELLRGLASMYDKGVKKGIYTANTAARDKSRLARKVNALIGPAAAAPSGEQPPAAAADQPS
jgi:small subunit ribosomal protein S20